MTLFEHRISQVSQIHWRLITFSYHHLSNGHVVHTNFRQTHIDICIHKHIYIYIQYTHVYYIHVYIYIHMYTHTHTLIILCTCMYMSISLNLSLSLYIYIYTMVLDPHACESPLSPAGSTIRTDTKHALAERTGRLLFPPVAMGILQLFWDGIMEFREAK